MKRLVSLGFLLAVLAGFFLTAELPGHRQDARAGVRAGIHKIRHVVIIMQENRSFDSYFGTYPGADGFPMKHGSARGLRARRDPPHVRQAVPRHLRPELGRPARLRVTRSATSTAGRMDGFVREARSGLRRVCNDNFYAPECSYAPKNPDVMGYHDWHEIPNYWAYAQHFVLDDHMFESDISWSKPEHLYLVSGWSASARTSSTRCPATRPCARCIPRAWEVGTRGPTSPISSIATT